MSSLPRAFHQIRLEFVRERGHPQDDANTGYLITAPLDAGKHLDANLWKAYRDNCRVIRFREHNKDVGHLVRKPGRSWSFRYDIAGDNADDSGFNLQQEKFVTGEYVSVCEGDLLHMYRVTSVENL